MKNRNWSSWMVPVCMVVMLVLGAAIGRVFADTMGNDMRVRGNMVLLGILVGFGVFCLGFCIWDQNRVYKAQLGKRVRVAHFYEELGFGTWDLVCQGRVQYEFLYFEYRAILRNRSSGEEVCWISISAIPACGVQIGRHESWEAVPLEASWNPGDGVPADSRTHDDDI